MKILRNIGVLSEAELAEAKEFRRLELAAERALEVALKNCRHEIVRVRRAHESFMNTVRQRFQYTGINDLAVNINTGELVELARDEPGIIEALQSILKPVQDDPTTKH